MEKRQKKIIIITLLVIAILICLGLSITWLVSICLNWSIENWKELIQWLFANFGTLTLGVIIKMLINFYNIKKIEKTHETYGLTKNLEPKPKKIKQLSDIDKINNILNSNINNENKIQKIKKILGDKNV